MAEVKEQGHIQVSTENIFPIIKKFLYADHEIFLRELVSNGVDACQKLKRLASVGEFQGEVGELKVEVVLDKEGKKIIVKDNGIGMTLEEVKKYINQVAFSGAAEFVQRYKEAGSDIIGKFGLGFYSAFMVADKVELVTKSFREDAPAVKWSCAGDTRFEIEEAQKQERGTEVILHIGKEGEEFLNKFRIQEILEKYARFLPVPVWFDGKQINDTKPIWVKPPQELKDEDYLNFYKQLFPFAEDPLFWIHLNVDYPFTLTGVLYFPKITNQFDMQKSRIQLYSRQVFITDEVRDIVPEFLMLLHGVIDSPDIPLNVSRSYLQSDSNVRKINQYITKKVAEKLQELFHKDRKAFEEKWEGLGLFVKYGMITDDKFFEKAQQFCLLKNTEGQYFTIDEYKSKIETVQKDKHGVVVVLYAQDTDKQYTYIEAARKRGYDVLLLDGILDAHFIQRLEMKLDNFRFKRVDADSAEKLIEKEDSTASHALTKEEEENIIKLLKDTLNDDKLIVKVEALSMHDLPIVIVLPEFLRRMKEMSQLQGQTIKHLPSDWQIIINGNHVFIQKVLQETDNDRRKLLLRHAYDLALLSQGQLQGKPLHEFIERSLSLVEK
ncbi:molecular chaperone HtpG [Thermonema lapsum]|uniref:Chaperone protein HtpG n=1 Tax=Thermonema lapsum TaxID=28195 RepID=A0A846MTF3_9BACT|nr:molecular chaperone HtpG [Thermonema lapsum]NIK74866.1 molecular chaperone HtpG [Thermonema lapsum]